MANSIKVSVQLSTGKIIDGKIISKCADSVFAALKSGLPAEDQTSEVISHILGMCGEDLKTKKIVL